VKGFRWFLTVGLVVLGACTVASLCGEGAKKAPSAHEGDATDVVVASLPGQAAKRAPSPRDWDQWRGPTRNGLSSETDWTCKWPDMGPRELWRIKLAPGYSTVSVRNGLVYTNGGTFKDEMVCCLNARNGSEVWKFTFPATPGSSWKWTRGPYATPSVDGALVFAQSMSGYVVALDSYTGQMVWGKGLVKEAGRTPPIYGYSSSPLVVDGLVIVSGGMGLEKRT